MPKTNPAQRVGVFVDVQNLYYSARNIYGSRVNFNEVLKVAVGDRQLMRAIAYVIKADMPEEHTFFDALDKAGFEVKSKELQTFYGGAQKGDWDVGITIDIVKMMPKLDVVVLCGGDGDYAPLLEYLQNTGVLVEVCAFGKSTAKTIKEIADKFVDLDENKKYLIPIKGFKFFRGNSGGNTNNGNANNGSGNNNRERTEPLERKEIKFGIPDVAKKVLGMDVDDELHIKE